MGPDRESPDRPPREVELVDMGELGRLVKERRGKTSLRAAAEEAGVSFSTLTRVESGAQPDLTSYVRICAWLGTPPSRFFPLVAEREVSGLETAISHLRQDPRLDEDAKTSISRVLTEMYASLAREAVPDKPLVACHLRAASVLRPGVPHRMASLLQDMHKELERRVEEGSL